MIDGHALVFDAAGAANGLAVEPAVEDRLDRTVGVRADLKGSKAGGFEARRVEGLGHREVLDRRDRNSLTGAEFPVPALANPRVARFTLPLLSAAEVQTQHRALMAALGGLGEALWIPETSLAAAEFNARSIWGGGGGARGGGGRHP